MGYGPITHFTDIEAWKLARKLRVAVYSVIIDNQYIFKGLYDKIQRSQKLQSGMKKAVELII
jgi:hypothetical protein